MLVAFDESATSAGGLRLADFGLLSFSPDAGVITATVAVELALV
jgi:hypothetical protein